jgi:nitroreductase
MADLTIFRLIFLYQILIFLSDLLITKKTYSENGIPNRLHFHDLGAANENMFLEAFKQGLIMHEMGGFDVRKAREVFNIPEDYEIGSMIAIGYQDTHIMCYLID